MNDKGNENGPKPKAVLEIGIMSIYGKGKETL
jgi:hypothetical protein